jgi:hypothetical protein
MWYFTYWQRTLLEEVWPLIFLLPYFFHFFLNCMNYYKMYLLLIVNYKVGNTRCLYIIELFYLDVQ